MDNRSHGNVTDEVESRLADLFGESEENPAFMEDSSIPEDFPLKGLKTTLLSVDWEISDEVMTTLVEEIAKLEDTYNDDKTLLLFLRLLGSVGKYIKANKANTHPGAIKLLNSVYNSLESVLLSEEITDEEKRQTLLVQVKEFKKLKEQIALQKADALKEREAKPPEEIKTVVGEQEEDAAIVEESRPPDMSRMPPHEAFVYALEEIKQVINAEFRALRAELKLWREGG